MTFRQEPHLSGFFPLAERRNSEWHVSGLLPLRSRLSAGPGHPAVNRDSAIGLGTTQNTRRLRSRLSDGFWPLLLANETPRVRTGTTQNTRRPVAAWACGFWPPSPVNKTPRVTLARSEYPLPRRLGVRFRASGSPWTGLPFSSGTLRDQRIPSGSAEVHARLESDRRDLPSPTPRCPEGWNLARSETNESPRVPRRSAPDWSPTVGTFPVRLLATRKGGIWPARDG